MSEKVTPATLLSRTALRWSPNPLYTFDPITERILEANQFFLDITGYTAEEIITLTIKDLVASNRETIDTNLDTLISDSQISIPITRYRRKDQQPVYMEVNASLIPFAASSVALVCVRDVTSHKKAYDRLQLASKVFDNTADGIIVTDAQGVIQFANPAVLQAHGYELSEVLGMTPRILKSDRQDDMFFQTMWQRLISHGQWQGEIWNRHKDGTVAPYWLSITAIFDHSGQVIMYAGVLRDLSERLHHEEQLRYQAHHDALTGLPNRYLFHDRLDRALTIAKREGHQLALFFLDLDGFKSINDRLGHNTGDLLLQAVGSRLSLCVRESDTIARMGGDEFTVILPVIHHQDDAALVADKILIQLREPFLLGGHTMTITTSLGIALYPSHGEDVQTLMKHADQAMYQAKETGKNRYCFFANL